MYTKQAVPRAFALLVALGEAANIHRQGSVKVDDLQPRRKCTVYANGGNSSDVSNILSAFEKCGNGGTVVFPEDQDYFIASKLNPVVNVSDHTTVVRNVADKPITRTSQLNGEGRGPSAQTLHTGVGPRITTRSPSKTTQPHSSSLATESISMAMAPAAFTATETCGIPPKQAIRNQVARCPSYSGTCQT